VSTTPSFDFAKPDLFTAGAIGPPGQRVFYLQAREGDALVTLKCEKEQVRALAEYLGQLLEQLGPVPAAAGDLALVEPISAAWIVGSIAVAYDEGTDRVVLVIEEIEEAEAEDEGGEGEPEPAAPAAPEPEGEEGEEAASGEGAEGASGRVRLTRVQTAAFIERARALVRAGRPTCRLCGRPINPGGHRCARTNGHRVD
jgi:uncharacterized repeat protein (TIGR03847 family)